jgi:hypothetical protein
MSVTMTEPTAGAVPIAPYVQQDAMYEQAHLRATAMQVAKFIQA